MHSAFLQKYGPGFLPYQIDEEAASHTEHDLNNDDDALIATRPVRQARATPHGNPNRL